MLGSARAPFAARERHMPFTPTDYLPYDFANRRHIGPSPAEMEEMFKVKRSSLTTWKSAKTSCTWFTTLWVSASASLWILSWARVVEKSMNRKIKQGSTEVVG